MKLAFYIGSLNRGGAERVISNLANFFCERGYEVVMVTKLKEKNEYILHPDIPRIIADITPEEETTSRVRNFVRRVKKLRNIWKKEKPDLIISFIKKNNFMAIVSCAFLKPRVVISVRSAPEREYGTWLERALAFFLFQIADGVILQTRQAFSFFPKTIQRKAVLLPNSLTGDFLETPYTGIRKKEIVSVGRIDENKNQIMLVKAFEKISERYPEWKCLIYGDGEGTIKLQEYIQGKKLDSCVKLMGKTDNVKASIEQSSIFVLTSRVEGMPNALIEAMALGLAVVSTDCPCGGPADLIMQGENGILVEVDDTEALADALIQMIENEVVREQMGKSAAEIRERLHPNTVNQEWETYVQRVMR